MKTNTTHVYYAILANGQGISEHITLTRGESLDLCTETTAVRRIAEKHATGQGTSVEGLSLWVRSKIPTGIAHDGWMDAREAFNALSEDLQDAIAQAYFIKCHDKEWRLSYWEESTWQILFEELGYDDFQWTEKEIRAYFKDTYEAHKTAVPLRYEAELDARQEWG